MLIQVKLSESNSRERTLQRQNRGGWILGPPNLAASLRITHDHPVSSCCPLFTAAWWAPPLPAADCLSCLRSPAWTAGCPTQQTGGLAQPGAIWMWATWTCDKKQKPWWGGRPSLQHKIKQPKEEGMERRCGVGWGGGGQKALQDTGEEIIWRKKDGEETNSNEK